MSVFDNVEFHDQEQVSFFKDGDSGLKAIVAIHNTRLGPALGGCRMLPYASEAEALTDVLRLARGMTYKSALANLPLGGGKSVIIGDPHNDKSPALLRAFGRCLQSLGGRYIAAEDSGTTVEDIKTMASATDFVAGLKDKPSADGSRSGDPSPATAYGVLIGLRAAVRERLGRDDIQGLKIAIQGVGNVGFRLARDLHQAGAVLWVADTYDKNARRAADELGASVVQPDQIAGLDVDVFSPCALGGAINDQDLPRLQAKVIAGAANNQLAEPRHGQALRQRNILYAPDYVINAGGIIDIALEREGFDRSALLRHLDGIGETLTSIFSRSRNENRPPETIADAMAEEKFRPTRQR